MKEKKLKSLMKKVANNIIQSEMIEWPPGCFALSYQPVRPLKATCSNTNNTENRNCKGK